MNKEATAQELKKHVLPLTKDYDSILALAKDKSFVLIGEATHGTHEFYKIRAEITKHLIAEHGFMAVAAEADWPDAYRINRYVMGDPAINNAEDSLSGFKRFPEWMWRNKEVLKFVNWLYNHNHQYSQTVKAGFYGLDLYSLNASVEAVIQYLDSVDPEAAFRARQRYGCFDLFGNNPQVYGQAASRGISKNCEDQIIAQLKELQQSSCTQHDGAAAQEEFFSAEQNAQLVADAERYYRSMFKGRPSSWNIRDTHMADTLDDLADHLTRKHGKPAKIVVWAHNSHIGDARATDMATRGEINIGQLMRENHVDKTLLIGFSGYNGKVTAASDWDESEESKPMLDALPGSIEELFHDVNIPNFWLDLRSKNVRELLLEPRLQRFIGVIYRPQTERWSHYYNVRLAEEFDVIIHLDKTHALHPLNPGHLWEAGEMAETYPTGL